MLTSFMQFMEMQIFYSSSIWHLPVEPKLLVTGVLTMVLMCLTDQATVLT